MLNDMESLPFPYLIRKLCQEADISPNNLVDRWGESPRLIQITKINGLANHLFGSKSVVVGAVVVFLR